MSDGDVHQIVQLVRAKAANDTSLPADSRPWASVPTSCSSQCAGVAFQGRTHEAASDLICCLYWASEVCKRTIVRAALILSSLYRWPQDVEPVSLPAHLQLTSNKTYRLFASLRDCLASNSACIEFATFQLKPSASYADFAPAWHAALAPVLDTPGCGTVVLGQQVNDASSIVHIQPWKTLSDHLDGFMKRKDLGEVMGPLSAAIDAYILGGWSGFHACHLMLEEIEQ